MSLQNPMDLILPGKILISFSGTLDQSRSRWNRKKCELVCVYVCVHECISHHAGWEFILGHLRLVEEQVYRVPQLLLHHLINLLWKGCSQNLKLSWLPQTSHHNVTVGKKKAFTVTLMISLRFLFAGNKFKQWILSAIFLPFLLLSFFFPKIAHHGHLFSSRKMWMLKTFGVSSI